MPSSQDISKICDVARDSSSRGSGSSLRELIDQSEYRRLRPTITAAVLAEYLAALQVVGQCGRPVHVLGYSPHGALHSLSMHSPSAVPVVSLPPSGPSHSTHSESR